MKEVDVVGHLTKAGVRLVLHGDVHEANPAVNPFRWPRLTVLGAGAFGATWEARPESIPGLYQVIELRPGDGPGGFGARVHTRPREGQRPLGGLVQLAGGQRWGRKRRTST